MWIKHAAGAAILGIDPGAVEVSVFRRGSANRLLELKVVTHDLLAVGLQEKFCFRAEGVGRCSTLVDRSLVDEHLTARVRNDFAEASENG